MPITMLNPVFLIGVHPIRAFMDWIFDCMSTAVQSAVLGLLKIVMKSFLNNDLTPTLHTFRDMFSTWAGANADKNMVTQIHYTFVFIGVVAALLLFGIGIMISLINIDNMAPVGIGVRFFRLAVALILIGFVQSSAFQIIISNSDFNPGVVVWNFIEKSVTDPSEYKVTKNENDTDKTDNKSSKKTTDSDNVLGAFDKSVIVWTSDNADDSFDSKDPRAQVQSLVADIGKTITGFYLVKGLLMAVVDTVFYVIVCIELIKLIIELLQRYIWLCILHEMMPVGCAFFANPLSMNCFISYWRMYFTEFFIVAITKMWISLSMFLISTNVTSMFNAIFIIGFIRVGMSLENWFKSLGWSTASTGGALGDAIRNDFTTIMSNLANAARLGKNAGNIVGAPLRAAGAATGDIGAFRMGSLLSGKPYSASDAVSQMGKSTFNRGINPDSAARNMDSVVKQGGGLGRNAALQGMLANMSPQAKKDLTRQLTAPGGMLHDLNERLNKDGLQISSIDGDGRGITGTMTDLNTGREVGKFTLGEGSTNGIEVPVGSRNEGFAVKSLDMNGMDQFNLQSGSMDDPSGINEVSMGTMAGIDTANVYDALQRASDTPGLENATLDNVTAIRGSDGGWDFVATPIDSEGNEYGDAVALGHQTGRGDFIPAEDVVYSGMDTPADAYMSNVQLGEGLNYVAGTASVDSSGISYDYTDKEGNYFHDGHIAANDSINSTLDTNYGTQTGATLGTMMAQDEFLSKGQMNTNVAENYVADQISTGHVSTQSGEKQLEGAQIIQGSAHQIQGQDAVSFSYRTFDAEGNSKVHNDGVMNIPRSTGAYAEKDGMYVGLAKGQDIRDMRLNDNGSVSYLDKNNRTITIANANGNLAEKGNLYQIKGDVGMIKTSGFNANKKDAEAFKTFAKEKRDNRVFPSDNKKNKKGELV